MTCPFAMPIWEGASGDGRVQVGAMTFYTGLDNGVPS